MIYDDDCGFCRWSLAVLLSLDRGGVLEPLPLGTVEADRLLADLTVAEREASWHFVVGPTEVPGTRPPAVESASNAEGRPPVVEPARNAGTARTSAGAALAPALALLPGGRLPAEIFARFSGAAERGYRWVAEHRAPLGRLLPARASRWADRVIAAHGGPARPQ